MKDRHQFSDLAMSVARLEQILSSIGIEITDTRRSPFKQTQAILQEMDHVSRGLAAFDNSIDQREKWRKAISLGDLALKLVAAHDAKPNEFKKLAPHLRYLAGDAELSLCSFARGGHSGPLSEQQNDFIAELRLAASCIQMMDDLEFDPPAGTKKSKGKNPDIVGRFLSRKWAVETKTLHPDWPGAEQSPEAFLSRATDARDQIKDAILNGRADTGVVVVNMKNTVDPDSFLPTKEMDDGIYYGSHENLPFAAANLVKKYHAFITPVSKILLERGTSLSALLTDPDQGGHPSIAPCVLAMYFVTDGVLKDGQPALTMLRGLNLEPKPDDPSSEIMRFAQKLNGCLQDQPNHPGDTPIETREDFIKWASNYGPFVLHERQALDPKNVPPDLLTKLKEFEASGQDSLEWEEVDNLGNRVVRVIYKRPVPKAD